MFMFTEINCLRLKDAVFNEQLSLAALKMLVRDRDRHIDRRSIHETLKHQSESYNTNFIQYYSLKVIR